MISEAVTHLAHGKELDRIERYNDKIQELSNKYNSKIQSLSVKVAKNWANLEVIESFSKNLLSFEKLKAEVEGKIEKYKKEIFIIEENLNPVLDNLLRLKEEQEKEIHYYERRNEEVKKEFEKLSQLKNIIVEEGGTGSIYIRYNVTAQNINNILQEIEELEEKILDLEKSMLRLKEEFSEEIKKHIMLQGELKELIAKKEIMERTGKLLILSKATEDVVQKNKYDNSLEKSNHDHDVIESVN